MSVVWKWAGLKQYYRVQGSIVSINCCQYLSISLTLGLSHLTKKGLIAGRGVQSLRHRYRCATGARQYFEAMRFGRYKIWKQQGLEATKFGESLLNFK